MNKYLMMSAAALLGTAVAGAAQAGSYSVHFGTAGGGSYCDGLRGHSGNNLFEASFVYSHCYSGSANVPTVALGSKGEPPGKSNKGGQVGFLNYAPQPDTPPGTLYLDDIQTPIKAGGNWALYVCFGSSCFVADTGVLLPGQYAKFPGKPMAPSTTAKLADVRGTDK
jgi:hypothetical protein